MPLHGAQPEWIPLNSAARLAGTTRYKILKGIATGRLRSQTAADGRVSVFRADAEALRSDLGVGAGGRT